MDEKSEMELALSILRKHNMPISPILEYAIQERIDVLGRDDAEVENQPYSDLDDANPLSTVADPKEPYISNLNIEDFENHLLQTKSAATAHRYMRILDSQVREFINKGIDPNANSIYSYRSPVEIKACITKLEAIKEFSESNARWHRAFTAALNAYLKYIIAKGL